MEPKQAEEEVDLVDHKVLEPSPPHFASLKVQTRDANRKLLREQPLRWSISTYSHIPATYRYASPISANEITRSFVHYSLSCLLAFFFPVCRTYYDQGQ